MDELYAGAEHVITTSPATSMMTATSMVQRMFHVSSVTQTHQNHGLMDMELVLKNALVMQTPCMKGYLTTMMLGNHKEELVPNIPIIQAATFNNLVWVQMRLLVCDCWTVYYPKRHDYDQWLMIDNHKTTCH